MTPEPWPDWLDHLWAKSPEKGEGAEAETLARHTWLVLSRLADFIRLRAPLARQISQPRLWHCLYWGSFLHDFGKALPNFQGVLRKEKARKEAWGAHRHEVFSLAFLDWIIEGLNDQEKCWAGLAIVSHHKDIKYLLYQAYPSPEEGNADPLAAQLSTLPESDVLGLHRWLTECGWPWAQSLGLDDYGVAPLTFTPRPDTPFAPWGTHHTRQWLGIFGRFVRKLGRETRPQTLVPLLALRGMLMNADHSASGHLAAPPSLTLRREDVIEKRGLSRTELFQHQRDAETLTGSVLLAAPTGSGKTEAALLWAATQTQNKPSPPRLFYTLPYQASMNAMQLRLQEIFDPPERKTDEPSLVGLQHGRSLLALYHHLMERGYEPEKATTTARQMRDLNRLNYPPVRVFSPYQMLKGMYRLKGYEAQLTDYYDALFIFDEIHAYEVKRLALILKMIEYLHRHYQARFFVMSATFPSLIKRWLRAALDDPAEIFATADLYDDFRRHRLDVIEGEMFAPENFARIVADARAGKSALVVCNLVDRAQQAYNRLKFLQEEGVEVVLLHGRFNLRDRLIKEKLVRDASGSRSEQRRAIVLVATQVVEVSLDIDLNTIYTEPAPLEALVQRFGRINRRRRMADLAPVHVFTEPDDGQKIYDGRLITGTLAVLRRENGNPLDESKVGAWLDEIYAGEIAAAWETEFAKMAEEFQASVVHTLRPFDSSETLKEEFYKAFDGIDVLPEACYDEYLDLWDNEPIRARELLVSISWGRFQALKNNGQVLAYDRQTPPVVRAPYNSEIGLLFEKRALDDDLL